MMLKPQSNSVGSSSCSGTNVHSALRHGIFHSWACCCHIRQRYHTRVFLMASGALSFTGFGYMVRVCGMYAASHVHLTATTADQEPAGCTSGNSASSAVADRPARRRLLFAAHPSDCSCYNRSGAANVAGMLVRVVRKSLLCQP